MAFYGIRKILLLISLSLLFFGNCQACEHGESKEEDYCSSTLRKLSNVFSCLFGDCVGASSRHHYERIDHNEDYQIKGLTTIESQPIDMLPNELLYQVAVFLSPPDIINLFKSNKKFSCLKRNDFWRYYNTENNYFSWYEETPAIKVAFSYYWFRNSKVRKAAAMGFPRACEFINQQEKLKRESLKSYEISSHVRHDHYDEIMHRKFFYKGGFYKKHW